jgi:hypothetical protein
MYTSEFPHSVDIYTVIEVRMPGGGYEETEVLYKEIDECFLSPLTDSKILQAMDKVNRSVFVLLMPYALSEGITSDMTVNQDMKFLGQGKNLGGQYEIM